MRQIRVATLGILSVIALIFVAQAQDTAGPPASNGTDDAYRPPRTSWGDPDLEGKWPSTNMAGVPLQRPESFGTRNALTDAEFAERQAQATRQVEQDNADFDFENPSVPFGQVGGGQSPPQHWFERGETQRQASLIVDPPNGRLPALTAAAQQREADRRGNAGALPASYTSFSLYERCITRGLIGSVMPGGYNNGNQIFQSPGYVTIVNEMIHESRIVPLDGRPHLSPAIRSHLGDSRGRWEGDTLVVETKNVADRQGLGANNTGASAALTITERFTRTSDTTLRYLVTVDDPMTWTAPFTLQLTLERDDDYGMFEYACHEGNHALPNILSGARATERANVNATRTAAALSTWRAGRENRRRHSIRYAVTRRRLAARDRRSRRRRYVCAQIPRRGTGAEDARRGAARRESSHAPPGYACPKSCSSSSTQISHARSPIPKSRA